MKKQIIEAFVATLLVASQSVTFADSYGEGNMYSGTVASATKEGIIKELPSCQ